MCQATLSALANKNKTDQATAPNLAKYNGHQCFTAMDDHGGCRLDDVTGKIASKSSSRRLFSHNVHKSVHVREDINYK